MVSDRGARAVSPQAAVSGRVRWIVVALLFAATAINYVDRQMLGLLKPTLEKEFGWSEETYANDIVFMFQLAYAAGYIFFGNIVDRIGARLCSGVRHLDDRAHAPRRRALRGQLRARPAVARHR